MVVRRRLRELAVRRLARLLLQSRAPPTHPVPQTALQLPRLERATQPLYHLDRLPPQLPRPSTGPVLPTVPRPRRLVLPMDPRQRCQAQMALPRRAPLRAVPAMATMTAMTATATTKMRMGTRARRPPGLRRRPRLIRPRAPARLHPPIALAFRIGTRRRLYVILYLSVRDIWVLMLIAVQRVRERSLQVRLSHWRDS